MPEIHLWSKSYIELKKTRPSFYLASVRKHHWPDHYTFQAIPNRGDWCVEFLSTNKEEVISKADDWANGNDPVGFYSASL